MTVIVYRDGVMAADSAAFMGGVIVDFACRKIVRTPSGYLVGCAGKMTDIGRFVTWAVAGFPQGAAPKGLRDFGALCVAPDGTVTKYDAACVVYPWAGTWAIEGSEEEFLAGALAHGATAVEAVALAIKHCAWAGGEVMVERLNA